MAITFYDEAEVKEYIENKHGEGYVAYYIKKNGKYVAYVLRKLSGKHPKIIKEDQEYVNGDIARWDSAKNEIRYGKLATAKDIEHEIGHAKLGHHQEWINERDVKDATHIAKMEIDAEIYAYTKQGMGIDYKVALPALDRLSEQFKISDKKILSIVEGLLRKRGIEMPAGRGFEKAE